MTLNKSQLLLLRQYRELHEATSPKQVVLVRMLKVFLGSMVIAGAMPALLYFAGSPGYAILIPFGVGLILGNSATNLGALMRRVAGWAVVDEITNWPKVYEMLDDKRRNGKR